MKKIIALIVWLIVICGLVSYLASHSGELKKLLHLSVTDITLLAALFIFTQILNGFKFMLCVGVVGVRMGLWEAFNLANINTMVNYLPLKGGFFAAAFYLKNKHSLSYTSFANITIASQLVLMLTVGFASSLFIIVHYLVKGIFFKWLFLIFFLIFAASLLGVLIIKRFIKSILYFLSNWEKIKKITIGLNLILSNRPFLIRLVLLELLIIVSMGIRFAVCFKILSFNAPLIVSFLAGSAKITAMLISIVPSGLGIAELFAGGVSEMSALGVNIGVYAAAVDRVVSVVALILISSVSFVSLYRHKGN